jgi:DNA (cytosine-5)-methyltransferase 3A
MIVLSLFDGISCAYEALVRAGVPITKYYASEVDKHAIEVSKKRHPDIVQLGDVKGVKAFPVDLLIGGSPCQDLSVAKKGGLGLNGERSGLFFEYVRLLDECKPKYFVLENVASMKADDRNVISLVMGVEPIMIDASLVSAQSRKRYFWTNIPVDIPADKGIMVKDILLKDVEEKYYIKKDMTDVSGSRMVGLIGANSQGNRVYTTEGKSATLSANGGGLGAKTGLYKIGRGIRRLTPVECERLQGLSDGYTEGISETQRYKCLGNAFNVDAVCHILNFLQEIDGRK